MITALNHVVLLCSDLEAGIADYQTVFGVAPVWRSEGDGAAQALFKLNNTNLELIAPFGEGVVSEKLRAMTADGPKLTTLAYQSDDLSEDHRLFTRRGLEPSEIGDGQSEDLSKGAVRTWQRFRVPDTKIAGIKTFILQNKSGALPEPERVAGAVVKLDHIVINTPNPQRAIANYGACMGLRFALERVAEQWKTHFLFFRIGDLTLEIIHRLGEDHDPTGDDSLWGITWAVDDLEAAHTRLGAAGVTVSEIRTGRKPGSRVFTLRDKTLGVPTLFIHHAAR